MTNANQDDQQLSSIADTRNPETVTGNSIVASGKDTPKNEDSLAIEGLPARALELLGLMRSGKRQIVAEKEMNVTGEEMLSWKSNEYFRSKCASLNTANWGARELTQAYLKANEFEIARTMVKRATSDNAKDSQRAGETIYTVTGLLSKSAGTSVTVNVDASARAWSQSQEQ